ncbi:MAG: 23S rRNA (guanosine(2251)-2'-O)-methyltransferase RlmB [Bacteroidota bacterium]|nr:23S rRNA (guanosine(2251)-2'-O)-methyltransferase RlmB [Bacteroidota bacterium]
MLIVGRNAVRESLRAGTTIAKIYIRVGTHGPTLNEIRQAARALRIPCITISKAKFDRLGDVRHAQGVAALAEEASVLTLDQLLARHIEQDPPFFAAAAGLTDPHNLGAMMRSAVCAGVHGLILAQRDTAMITSTVMKTSAGAASLLPVARVTSLPAALEVAKRRGIHVVGLCSEGETDLFAFSGTRPLCLVFGGEHGMRPAVRDACDETVRIPMWGAIDSLNVSVAAALAFYEVRRQRI